MDRSRPLAHLPFDTLVFDLGGVLVLHDNEWLFRRLADDCRALDALTRIRRAALDPRINSGEGSIEDLHAELRRALGYTKDWSGFLGDWSSHFTLDPAM